MKTENDQGLDDAYRNQTEAFIEYRAAASRYISGKCTYEEYLLTAKAFDDASDAYIALKKAHEQA